MHLLEFGEKESLQSVKKYTCNACKQKIEAAAKGTVPELLAITGLSPRTDVGRVSFLDGLDIPPTSKESSKLEADGMDDRP